MIRLSMAGILPTVVGLVALAGAVSGHAQESEQGAQNSPQDTDNNSQSQGWKVEQSDTPAANVDRTSLTNQVAASADSSRAEQDNDAQSSDLDEAQIWAEDGPELLTEQEQKRSKKIENVQLRLSVDRQFAQLQKTLESADAFSLELAEDYFGYGLLLRESGQYEDAIDAFTDALHIQKVNHGIYAPEQRPVLKALFETHYALGNVEDFEDYIERILWIESKNPKLNDDFSYEMLVMVGNRYIDRFLERPIAGQTSVQTLLRAKHHLNTAFRRHRNKPLSVALMPYGELALISFLESQLLDNVDKTASLDDPRLRRSRNLDGRELALASYLANSFPRGSGLLRSYLKKAETEENIPHVVQALISLGDFHQLFRQPRVAADYYKVAWEKAQSLPVDHKARQLLKGPVALPSFQYSLDRETVAPTKPSLMVPLKIGIGLDGRVSEVQKADESELSKTYFSRARRLVRRTVFRPDWSNGEPEEIKEHEFSQRVYARRGS